MRHSHRTMATRMLSLLLCLIILTPSSFALGQDTAERNFYLEGRAAAKEDYSGSGAVVGGLVSGFVLGLIGWGIGYLIVANVDVQVPKFYTKDFTVMQKIEFDAGYTDYVKKTKKNKFNIGGGIGTLGAIAFSVSAQNN